MATRTETVTVPDGGFALHVWTPEGGSGPGILLIQEIFGVGEYIRAVAQDLAGLGYVVAAPDMFWRARPGWVAPPGEKGTRASMGLASHFDFAKGLDDLDACLAFMRELPEVTGPVGVLGFCFGGTMAFMFGARAQGLSAVVSFYGSGVHDRLELLEEIGCPLQFHYGGSDPFIKRDQVARVESAVEGRDGVEIHVQEEAGHAFHNRTNPSFHHPEAAERAWRLTEEFLARHLPTA